MKHLVLSLLAAAAVLHATVSPAAIVPQLALSQGTNVVLSWASSPGDSFMVIHRQAFHPSRPWKVVATNLPAGPFSLTTFTHVGAVPPSPGSILWSGGGGGTPTNPSSTSLAAPDTTTSDKDKDKKQDSLNTLPALPDLKELEKLLREMIKEMEKKQKDNGNSGGGVQALSATYSLPDASYTNFSGGFYVITRAAEDTDLDGMPDWWEAQHELNLLANDAQEDPDGDGVPNLAEYAYGTNPRNAASLPVVYVSYTSPVNTNTFLPQVQITGSINLNVRSLRLDVTNAAGVTTDLEGFVTQRTVVPGLGFTNSPAKYTNAFHCFDVPLTNGANTVALRFTDAYGLTFATTVSFTVDFTASPAAPVGTVLWPASGTQLGTDTFTLRGRLDNPTASVVARLTLDGEEQEIGGLVERDGTFWLEDLPAPASGPLTLVFTDAGGKARTNTLNLTRSPVTLVLNDPSGPNLWDTAMNLSGSVSDPAYSVWINSVRATVDENGNWSADNVPVNAGGVASFALRAVPNSDNGGAGAGGQAMAGSGGLGGLYSAPSGNPGSAGGVDATFDFDKPPRIVVSSYTMRAQDDNPTFEYGSTNRQTLDWTRSGAGYSGTATAYYETKYPAYPGTVWRHNQAINYPFPGTNGYEVSTGLYTWGDPFLYTNLVGEPSVPWEQSSAYHRATDRTFARQAQTQLTLQTGGRGAGRTVSLFEFGVSVSATDALGTPLAVPSDQISLFGEWADTNFTVLKADLPLNSTLDATPVIQLAANASGGAIVNYGFGNQAAVLQAVSPLRYFNVFHTNGAVRTNFSRDDGIYLGYGGAYVSYIIRKDEILDGVLHQARSSISRYSIARLAPAYARTNVFYWDGRVFTFPPTEPAFVLNPPIVNTRKFASPASTYTAEAKVWRGTVFRTNALGTVRLTAKAVSLANVPGSDPHMATIATHLQTMRYTIANPPALTPATAGAGATMGLVWYSMTHGTTNGSGQFVGLSLNGLFSDTNLPPGLSYSLVFLNGCASASRTDPGEPTAEFRARFGTNCVFVGWKDVISHGNAMAFAAEFFRHLASGMAVGAAKDQAIVTSGLQGASSGQGSLLTVNDNITILPTDTSSMIVDLRN